MAADRETTAADAGATRRRWRHTVRRAALLSLLFAAIVGVMFFGLGALEGHPAAGELDRLCLTPPPDGPLVVWILSWSAHAFAHQPLHLFDANAFHPTEASLAYTESMAPLAPVYALLRGATGRPILALNLLVLLLTYLNLWGGYLLARWVTGRVDAGILGAVLFAFNGYAASQRTHVQLQAMFLVPVALWLLFRWLERRRWRDALGFAVAAAVQSLTVVYHGFLLLILVTLVLAGYLAVHRLRPGRRFFTGLLAAGALALALVAPFASVYLRFEEQRGGGRLNWRASLNPIDLLTPPVATILYPGLENAGGGARSGEHRFFFGFLAFGLAAVGLAIALADREGRARYAALLAFGGAACLLLAGGPEAAGVRLPFAWLRDHLPGFNGVRVPARLALGTLLAGVLLAAVGYARLTANWWRDGRSRRGVAVAVAVIAVALLENASYTRYSPIDFEAEAAVNRALAEAPDGAVVELPIAMGPGVRPARMESMRLMRSTLDWKPRVNGYSGSYPEGYFRRAVRLNGFPAPDALALLCELDVRWVVLRVDEREASRPFGRKDAARVLAALPPGASHTEHGGDHLVDLQGWRDAGGCAAAAGGV